MPSAVVRVGNYSEDPFHRREDLVGGIAGNMDGIDKLQMILAVFASYLISSSGYDNAGLVDEGYILAELLDRLHIVSRKDDGCSFVFQAQNLLADKFGVDRIEAGERLVEDHEPGSVDNGRYELNFLGHALRKLFHLLVPP